MITLPDYLEQILRNQITIFTCLSPILNEKECLNELRIVEERIIDTRKLLYPPKEKTIAERTENIFGDGENSTLSESEDKK